MTSVVSSNKVTIINIIICTLRLYDDTSCNKLLLLLLLLFIAPCGVSWFTVVDENSSQPLNSASSAIYREVNLPLPLLAAPTSSFTTLLVQGHGRGLILNSTISGGKCVYNLAACCRCVDAVELVN